MSVDAKWQVDALRLSTSARAMEWRGDSRLDSEIAFNKASADNDCLIVELVEWVPAPHDFRKREVRRQIVKHPSGQVTEAEGAMHCMVDGAEARAKLAEFTQV